MMLLEINSTNILSSLVVFLVVIVLLVVILLVAKKYLVASGKVKILMKFKLKLSKWLMI